MKNVVLYPVGRSDAIHHAGRFLENAGVVLSKEPKKTVTHLLLPVPSFDQEGKIRGGGLLEDLLSRLPPTVTVIGGHLQHPALAGYATIDLLQDGWYAAANGALTADCAIRVAGSHLPVTFRALPVLIIGWGRIGKCLAQQLRAMGAEVTVAARKEADRQILQGLGYRTAIPAALQEELEKYRLVFNTAPVPILTAPKLPNCIMIELASKPGILAPDVIRALALPGKMVPESAGKLIAETILRRLEKEETL